MIEFIEVKASPLSLAQRKLIYGVGVNDADYMTEIKINGSRISYPYYKRWQGMLERCYSARFYKRNIAYAGCSVTNDWLTFSNFKAWMEVQDWKGLELDKDVRIQGNKVYSPAACQFITKEVNTLLNDQKSKRGDYHQGVTFIKRTGKYKSTISAYGRRIHLGYYNTNDDAFNAYKIQKYEHIASVAIRQNDTLRRELLRYKIN